MVPGGTTHAWILLLLTMVIWGVTYALTRHAVSYVGVLPGAALRFGLGTIVLMALITIPRRELPRIPAGSGPRLLAGGIVGVALYNILFFAGLALAPSIDAAALMPVAIPISTTALALLVTGERPRPARAAGLAIGVAGAVLFLASATPDAATPHRLLGDLILLAASVVWGGYTLMGRPLMAVAGPLQATAWVVAVGMVVLVVLAIPAATTVDWGSLPPDLWGAILFLGAVSTAGGYSLYYRGVRDVGPTSAALAMLLLPITGSIASIVLLGESISLVQAAGAVTMAIGAVLAILAAPAPASAHRGTASGPVS